MRREARLVDACGRRLEYLRLSITDCCNFRCAYCLPDGCRIAGAEPPLSVAEIARLVRAFAALGFGKVRLTGGEPTLRGDLVEIVGGVAATAGIRHVGLTTNGLRLAAMAAELAAAGLTCLNVSVDSLDPGRFAAVTGRAVLPRVLAGVEAALAAGIPRVKVNAVLLAGVTVGELDRFLAWTRDAPLSVRFIELMDTGARPGFFARHHVPAAVVERLLAERGWTPLPRSPGDGPATSYGKAGHAGRVGVISAGEQTCAGCNRLRVSAAGRLKLCLFDRREVPLRGMLASDDRRDALVETVRAAVGSKPAARAKDVGIGSLATIGG